MMLRRWYSSVVLIFAVFLHPQYMTGHASASNACKVGFLNLVDSGQVRSVNGLAIAPGYSAFYFTEWFDGRARIEFRDCKQGVWEPSRPFFPLHEYADYQPALSTDGLRLYFTSTRPYDGDEPVRQNVWLVEKTDMWSEPTPIKSLISSFWDGHAVEIKPGYILFASARAGGDRMVDLYEVDFSSQTVKINPADGLNTNKSDNDLAFDMGSQTLLFSRYDSDTEDIDLFVAFRMQDGWASPVPLADFNTDRWEMSPAFTPDGQFFLFKRGDEPFQRKPVSVISDLHPSR